MRAARKAAFAILGLSLCAVSVHGQGQPAAPAAPAAPVPPATETVAPDIAGVVRGGTRVIVIKDDLRGTEGPVALPDGTLAFTEGGADRISRIDENDKVAPYIENANLTNAIGFDSKGRMVSVQRGTAAGMQIGYVGRNGNEGMLANDFDGNPNDLVVAKNDAVYFTVPVDRTPAQGGSATRATPFSPGVYYIAPGTKRSLKVAEGITNPNGITLSRDERTLYVNDTRGEYLVAMDVLPDGRLGPKRNFAKYEGVTKTDTGVASGADGLAIDADGRLYAATTVGVQVFSPQGQHLGTIPFSRAPQNLAFAGRDKKTLYVVGRNAAFKVQMLVSGYQGRAK